MVPSNGPFILASNHPSYFDPPFLATILKRRIYFLAKKELFRNWITSFFYRDVGAIPLNRDSSDFKAMRCALNILKEKPLLLFPQGVVGDSFDELKSGVGFLAKKSGVPVIVARIYRFKNRYPIVKKEFRKEKIRVVFSRIDMIESQGSNKEIAKKIIDEMKVC